MNSRYIYKNVFFTLAVIGLLVGYTGCKKFVEINPPTNQVVSSVVFSNDQTATSAVTGVYGSVMSYNENYLNGFLSVYAGLSADEFKRTSPNPTIDQFTTNSILPNNGSLYGLAWQAAYINLYQINSCIEGISKSTTLTPALKNQLTGESRFMQALFYFYLVNCFGDVPLITSPDYKLSQSAPRSAVASVYEQVIRDLHEAQSLLPASYPAAGPTRPNKWAAVSLLARAYLYQKNWAGADSAASAVIGSGVYQILPDLNQVFLANSHEAILQFIPEQDYFNTSEGNSFIPQFSFLTPNYTITSFLSGAFETNDARKTNWLESDGTYTYPFKYKKGLDFNQTSFTEYNTVLRLAEQYLIRAEAKAQLDDITASQSDLNKIRNRAGLPNTTAGDKTSLLTAILKERQVELFAEWGHRWFDLKRSGQINAILGSEKPSWTPTAALYPIPLAEIKLNPFLTQNDGY